MATQEKKQRQYGLEVCAIPLSWYMVSPSLWVEEKDGMGGHSALIQSHPTLDLTL